MSMEVNNKIKFFDIETTGLNADESFIIASAFNDNLYFLENPLEERKFLIDILKEFDGSIIVGYNIQRFDLPFIFSKIVEHRICGFDVIKVKYVDLMDIISIKTRLGRKTASSVNSFLGYKRYFPDSSRVPKNYIMYIASKDEKYKNEILNHLKEDIEITKRIFDNFIRDKNKLLKYVKIFTL